MQLRHWAAAAVLLTTAAVWASGGSISITPDVVKNAGIAGVVSGAAAGTGLVGETQKSCVTAASGFTATTNVVFNTAAISLSAGDWDITANCAVNGTLTGTALQCGVSATSGTMPAAGLKGDTWLETTAVSTAAADSSLSVSNVVQNLSATTTVYAVEKVLFTVGTAKGYGCISARRRR